MRNRVSALPGGRVTQPEATGGDMEGAHRRCSHWHGLGSCLEVRGLDQGRAVTLEVQKETSQSKGRKRSPTKNSLFSFHGPFPVSPSGSPGPSPHWFCWPRLAPVHDSSRRSPSLQRACSLANHPVICSFLRSWLIHTE